MDKFRLVKDGFALGIDLGASPSEQAVSLATKCQCGTTSMVFITKETTQLLAQAYGLLLPAGTCEILRQRGCVRQANLLKDWEEKS